MISFTYFKELKYLEMYNHILKYHPHFYFSYSYNLTKSLPHYLKKKSSTPQDEKKNPKKGYLIITHF